MNNETKTTPRAENKAGTKKGFFGRIFDRVDESMRRAAEKKSAAGCCCSPQADEKSGTDKGGKCC